MNRTIETIGLLTGAAGIVILLFAGVDFPVVPPGLVLLLAAAALVRFVPRGWTAAVGAVVALFILVGFVLSGTGFDDLGGDAGVAGIVGQAVEVVGVLVAIAAGVRLAVTSDEHGSRHPA